MKKISIKGGLVFLLTLGFLLTPTHVAKAAEVISIKLQIKTYDSVIFDDNFSVTACENSPSSSVFTFNAWCAVAQAATQNNWTVSSTWGQWGLFLNSINQYDGNDGKWWLWYANLEPGATALNQHELTDGETLLLTYGISPLKITADNLKPAINTTSTLTASYFNTDNWDWETAIDSNFLINEQTTTSNDGIYYLYTNSTSTYAASVQKTGYLDSDQIFINAVLPTANVNLRVETASSTVFNNNLTVSACENEPNSGRYTINGKCAIEQSGLISDWSWWGDSAFLNSIDNYANDFVNNIYWGWFADLNYGQTALNQHLITPNEKLLLVYNTNPLRVITTPTSTIGTTTTITLEKFAFDANFNPIWNKAESGTIVINTEEFASASGTYELLITTSTPYSIYGKKAGYLDSETMTVTGVAPVENNVDPVEKKPGNGGGSSVTHNSLNTSQALAFLTGKQTADGSIGAVMHSDWAAIALGALGQENETKTKIKQYLQTDPPALVGLNSVSDYARRAMALMALGINPYNGTATNYIQKITEQFDGNQLGDPNLFNDDIFALLPLLKTGYTPSDSIINNTTNFIVSKQSENGGWGSTDLTAAAVQALTPINNASTTAAIAKAKVFLQNAQQSNGGWGDVFSTGWVMQAIASLGENQTNWLKNNLTGGDYLYSQQAADGGLNISDDNSTRIWATAQAIPGALGKSWPMILTSFEKPAQPEPSRSGGASLPAPVVATTTATSTEMIATTTLNFVTTTPTPTDKLLNNLSIQAVSSTPVSTTPKIVIKKPVKNTFKVAKIIPEIKGEKISAKSPTTPATVATEPPKTKENILVKSVKWILRLFKNLI